MSKWMFSCYRLFIFYTHKFCYFFIMMKLYQNIIFNTSKMPIRPVFATELASLAETPSLKTVFI